MVQWRHLEALKEIAAMYILRGGYAGLEVVRYSA
jgi:hypothetical protein